MGYDAAAVVHDIRGKTIVRQNPPLFWLGAILFVLVSAAVFLLSTPYGIGILPDSIVYLKLFGQSHDAPLYTWLLMAVAATGIDMVEGAKLTGLLLVCANTSLIWYLLVRTTGSYGYAAFGTAIVILSPHFVALHSVAMSEPLFIFFVLTTLLMLLQFWETEQRFWLLGCGAAIGLAALVRFAAPTLGAAVALTLLLGPRSGRLRRLVDAGIVGAVSGTIFFLWVLLSELIAGRSTGRPLRLYGNMDAERWLSSLKAITGWLVPSPVPMTVSVPLFGLVMLGIGWLAVWHARRTLRAGRELKLPGAMLPIVLGLFFLFYMVFMLLAVSIEANLTLNGRYAFPVYLTTVIMATVLLAHARGVRGPVRRVHAAFVALAFLVLASHAARTFDRTHDAHAEGIGYASLSWMSSPVLQAVRDLPADATVYSNGPDVIGYVLKRGAQSVPARILPRTGLADPANPFDKQVEDVRQRLATGNTFVVVLDGVDWRWFYLASEADLVRLLDLELIDRKPDGRIYAGQHAPHGNEASNPTVEGKLP